jgi:hypothetical protein
LDGNLSSILIGSRKDEEAIDWCKRILKLSLDKGEQAQGGHGGSPRKKALCVWKKRRRNRRMKWKKCC